ncbi:hypothetical protein V1525DRAFT_410239 [Lipomyces kononenkoae]|uniref:Uncharacterized protein n=1 Tax=Lipomyces kononenkoae TaxID=34357 RepID=A0ACC3SUP7_LIPKO
MEYKYTPEELKVLAESPLCVRPDGLKPNEEWMGPPILQNNTPKASVSKPDREHGEDDPLRKFASHLSKDKKQISTRSKQDDIVLGPPKISFGSSLGLRKPSESDSVDKSTESIDLDSSFARRFERSRDASGSSSLSSGSRISVSSRLQPNRTSSSSYGRRQTREEDGDDWKEVSPRHARKSFGADDSEKFRRSKDDDRALKSESLNRERRSKDSSGGMRRDEGSWRDRDPEKERDRREIYSRDKSDRHGALANRYIEKSPEWMDSPAESDGLNFSNSEFAHAVGNSNLASSAAPPSTSASSLKSLSGGTAHSIEEFQAWKAKMKAADNDRKGVKESKLESMKGEDASADSASKPGISQPDSRGVDRFFGLASQAVTSGEVKDLSAAFESAKVRSPTDGSRSSRFSSFFRPEQATTSARESSDEHARTSEDLPRPRSSEEGAPTSSEISPETENSVPQATGNDDKDGFKRIMAILGAKSNRSSRNSTPVPVESGDASVPSVSSSQAASLTQQQTKTAPGPEGQNKAQVAPKTSHSNSSTVPDTIEAAGPTKDSSNAQFLRGLMSQSSKTRIHTQRQYSPMTIEGVEAKGSVLGAHQQQEKRQQQPSLPVIPPQQEADVNGKSVQQQLPPPGMVESPSTFNESARLGHSDPRLQQLPPMNQLPPQWAGHPMGPNGLRMLGAQGRQPLLPPLVSNALAGSPQLSNGMGPNSPPQGSKQQLQLPPDALGGPGRHVGPQQGFPPFPPGMIPPGANLPPFPPGVVPPFFGMQGPPGPPPPFPPGFPLPHLQHDPNLGLPPMSNMMPGGGGRGAAPNGMPPFAFGPPPPGLGFNGVSGNVEGDLRRGPADPQLSGK